MIEKKNILSNKDFPMVKARTTYSAVFHNRFLTSTYPNVKKNSTKGEGRQNQITKSVKTHPPKYGISGDQNFTGHHGLYLNKLAIWYFLYCVQAASVFATSLVHYHQFD